MTGSSPTDEFWAALRESGRRLGADDFRRLIRSDMTRAYGVLTREHAAPEPQGRLARWWFRARMLFLGMSAKLSPARRTLFVLCLVLALVGLVAGSDRLDASNSNLLLGISIAGLALLLGLELADRVVVRDELEVARALQRAMLPTRPPPTPGWDFAFSSRTANTIGGDFYDVIPLVDGRLAIVVGDASGHGIAAGLLMAIAGSTLKLAIDLDPSPRAVAELVNRALLRTGDRHAFMTLFYGLLEPASGRLELALAGHPFPLLRRCSGEVAEIGRGSLPLGIRERVEPFVGRLELDHGDLLAIVTDGIPEALDGAGRCFGFDRVRAAVAVGGGAVAVHQRLLGEVERFAEDRPADDDRSLLVVARQTPPPPIPSPPAPTRGGRVWRDRTGP